MLKENKKKLKLFIRWMVDQAYSKSSCQSYNSHLLNFIRYHADVPFDQITYTHIKHYIEWVQRQGYAKSYQRQFIGAIKLIKKWEGNERLVVKINDIIDFLVS